MILGIIIPVVAMALLGLVFGAGLAYALKIFGIEVDPTLALIISKLPGTNCGACGKAGCAGFAEALKDGKVMPAQCVVSDRKTRRTIARILGIKDMSLEQVVATLLCNGGTNAKDKYVYRGIKSCKAASLIFGGYKACEFGCLGLGDCVEVCPFDALSIGEQGIPVVNLKRCTACGNCVKTCPKNLFVLTPLKSSYYVKCSSKEPAAVKAKACRASCIACKKCEGACPVGAIKVDSNLSRIDYVKCQNIGKCFEVCPTKVIEKR